MARRVVLAYSGGLDTSVAVRWMIDELRGRGRSRSRSTSGRRPRTGTCVRERALRRRRASTRSSSTPAPEFAEDFVAPALKANAHVRGPLPAGVGAVAAGDRQAPRERGPVPRRRRGRPRLHRQGQRPGPLRGVDPGPRPRPRGDRARAGLGHDPRGVDPLRLPPRDPDPGDEGEGVLDRRQPLGPGHRVRRDGGSVGGAAAGRVAADQADRATEPRDVVIGFEQGMPVVDRRRSASGCSRSSRR